jgi:hypothetical protein
MEESLPTLEDVLEAAMISRDLLRATMTSSVVVEAILNLVDMNHMMEVILSHTNPEETVSNLYVCYQGLSFFSESNN